MGISSLYGKGHKGGNTKRDPCLGETLKSEKAVSPPCSTVLRKNLKARNLLADS
jgi:hypothetical protein